MSSTMAWVLPVMAGPPFSMIGAGACPPPSQGGGLLFLLKPPARSFTPQDVDSEVQEDRRSLSTVS